MVFMPMINPQQRAMMNDARIMGPVYMLAAALLFTLMNILVKQLGPHFTVWHIGFIRFGGGVVVLVALSGLRANPSAVYGPGDLTGFLPASGVKSRTYRRREDAAGPWVAQQSPSQSVALSGASVGETDGDVDGEHHRPRDRVQQALNGWVELRKDASFGQLLSYAQPASFASVHS